MTDPIDAVEVAARLDHHADELASLFGVSGVEVQGLSGGVGQLEVVIRSTVDPEPGDVERLHKYLSELLGASIEVWDTRGARPRSQ